jgi:histone H3/H4
MASRVQVPAIARIHAQDGQRLQEAVKVTMQDVAEHALKKVAPDVEVFVMK